MSRGPGKVERSVSAALRVLPKAVSAQLLARLVFRRWEGPLRAAELVTVKRALRRLERKGKAQQLPRPPGDRHRPWPS